MFQESHPLNLQPAVTAVDPDCGVNAMVNYTLNEANHQGLTEFEIRSSSGGLSTTAMVKIHLIDINDNRPVFYPGEYNVSLRESTISGISTSILTVVAHDSDTGRFGAVTYRIISGNEAGIFRLDRTSGEIFVNRPGMLTMRNQAVHVLNITASDGGGLRTINDALVNVRIMDATQRPPMFEKLRYNFYVKEDADRGAIVGSVIATNTDASNTNGVRYSIYSGDPDNFFSIDENSGNIRVNNNLDSEIKSLVLLNIKATAGLQTKRESHTQAFITVEDINDNSPEFVISTVHFSVPENAPLGKPLYTVNAYDKDSGENGEITYKLTMFSSTMNNNVTMPALAVSLRSNSVSVPAHIPQNSLAANVDRSAIHYAANQAAFATSAYVGGIGGGSTVKNLFTINARSGHLTLSRHLDYETAQRHTLIVTAWDSGNPARFSNNLTIVVEVQDVNDNPPVFEHNEYHIQVLESLPVNSQILQVKALDMDKGNNARIIYNFTSEYNNDSSDKTSVQKSINSMKFKKITTTLPSGCSSRSSAMAKDAHHSFGIYSNNGWIYLRSPLDRETCGYFEVDVMASDNGIPPAKAYAHVFVNVLDANDNDPRFLSSAYEFHIEENMVRGSLVGVVAATDLDLAENAAISYRLFPANGSFQINALTGEVITREPLDREQQLVHDLVAEARDQGTPNRSARVPIKVLVSDVNDNAPDIVDPQEDVISVREEQPPGTEVVHVRAVDRDSGQNASITYSILKGRDSDGFGLFSIDASKGVIRTLVALDHEERSIYRLTVAATDGGNPPKQSIRLLRVEVLNLNDNRPTFTSCSLTFSVAENIEVGSAIGSIDVLAHNRQKISSHDNDFYVTYTVIPLSKDIIERAFDIDRHTGSLVVACQLDRETQAEFRLEIRALDTTSASNPQSSTITVKIEVTDINDNPPIWSQNPININVSELTPEGTVIYNFTASDADIGCNGQVQYKLIQYFPKHNCERCINGEEQLFTIDMLTGGLTLVGSLDYETVKEYTLIVQGFDLAANESERLYSTVSAKLEILDENDNEPEFVIPVITSERLNAQHGLITTKSVHSTVVQPSASVLINNNKRIGEIVTHVLALDLDSDNNGLLSYSIEHGNDSGFFRINSETGIVELAQRLPSIPIQADSFMSPTPDKYELFIKAQDHGEPDRKSSLLNLKIMVQDTKSNPPRFLQSVHFANVTENAQTNSFVIQVVAKSNNGRDIGNLTYEIPTGVADNHFRIDTNHGIVTTNGQFDRETKAHYTLPIYVYNSKHDGSGSSIVWNGNEKNASMLARKQRSPVTNLAEGQHRQFDITTLHITITDVNDHAPEFRPGSCYPLFVPENNELAVIHTVVATDLDEGANAEIFYSIIAGNVGNKFTIDMHTGELAARPLDREQHSRYTLQIQANDRGSPISYQGHCNITVNVGDQNDNDPHFELAKYLVNVAEDVPIGTSVVRIKATDEDLGLNGRLLYTLANETQWLFAIDNKSGIISTVGHLDRERQQFFTFSVVATDGGRYDSRSAHVPVQIIIDDVNDNKPVFERYPFRAHVPALIQPGQTLLQVNAFDRDLSLNGEVLYTLNDENDPALHGKFRINPNTGVLSATQSLASESGRLLHLDIIARDKGNPALFSKGLIELRVGEISNGATTLKFHKDEYRVKLNENSLVGTQVLQVSALRSDGRRSKLVYSFGTDNDDGGFVIDSNSGEIRVANSSALDYERYVDTNHGPLASANKGINFSFVNLRGRAILYNDNMLSERIDNFTVVSDLKDENPLRNFHARRRREMEGLPVLLATDTQPHEIRLMVMARSESHAGSAPLYAYAEFVVELEDANDNSPQFTQPQYAATVWEGNSKGTFVAQVKAIDADSTTNSRVLYHIVDGNHDNAFVIEPAFSGIVKTNIVLDREIRDMYKLKVIATDEGVPQMTGTATIHVHIVDVNDNQPTFPPHSVISVSEGTELGTAITTISANDVDTYPTITYEFSFDDTLVEAATLVDNKSIFAIDRYSGKIILKRQLDYEECQEYLLEIIASDVAHEARTILTVRVDDENDNAPEFGVHQPPVYFAVLPDPHLVSISILTSDIELAVVNASDRDASETNNSKVYYSINPAVPGFKINEETGVVTVNLSSVADSNRIGYNYVTIIASDAGTPQLKTSTVLRVQTQNIGVAKAEFLQSHYHARINEKAPLGTTVIRLGQEILDASPCVDGGSLIFTIVSGNEEGIFEIFQSNAIILVKSLDREHVDLYKLRMVMADATATTQQLNSHAAENSTSAINVFVAVEDANDNAPHFFNNSNYEAEVSELAPLRHSVAKLTAVDIDAENTPNSEVVYEITSGNDESMFTIDLITGVLFVNNKLDYDTGIICYELIIRACDSATHPLCTLQAFRLALKDENDNAPKFPVMEYIEFVAENEPLGTSVFRARATDLDRGVYGQLNYSIDYEVSGSDDIAWKLFRVDTHLGLVTTNAVFDFEQRSRYHFFLRATDAGGKFSRVKVRIQIDSRDEFAPQFTERTYRFVMPSPSTGHIPLGFVVGHVATTDKDKGPDGRVFYQINSQNTHFKINRTTGAIILKKKLSENFDTNRDISLVISASSGRQGSLTNMTVVEISLDPLADSDINLPSDNVNTYENEGVLYDWVLGLVISLLLLLCAAAGIVLFIRMRKSKPNRNVVKPHLSSEIVGNANSYVDPSAFDTMPVRTSGLSGLNVSANVGAHSSSMAGSQFPPPKYDEIPPYGNHAGSSNSGAATTSELSGSEQSGSSGRGSAEDDGEDEEIRMINEGPLRGGSNTDDGGRLSDLSVQNTQEYLARLGIVDRDTNPNGGASTSSIAGSSKETHLHHPLPLHMFDEDPSTETDITNLIYAKLNEVTSAASDRGSSADEAATTAGSIGTAVDHVMGFSNVPVVGNSTNVGPSMNGSLSSIVHSEEELTGSYNWDYLLDWGPQYQPLAHVFSEIARLKDDNISLHSGNSNGSSTNKCKQSLSHSITSMVKPHIPPPLLTNVAPRAINLPVLSGAGVNMRVSNTNPHHMTSATTANHIGTGPQYLLPRSPINHDTAAGFSTSSAMSPSFSPSLSPLATRSPSISPLGGGPSGHHIVNMPRRGPQANQRTKSIVIEQVRITKCYIILQKILLIFNYKRKSSTFYFIEFNTHPRIFLQRQNNSVLFSCNANKKRIIAKTLRNLIISLKCLSILLYEENSL
uniref:Cadherin domain-containing protein n=1 Tax=Glossina morsitans morsitans TaxID=37546 RepID=A0A1B0GD92_GLOMM